jgi:hypothetical protein
MRQSVTIRTIQDHIDHEHGLTLYCDSCRHSAPMDLEAVAKRLGPTTVVGGKGSPFLRHFICAKCGSKDLSIRVSPIYAGRQSNLTRGIKD